MKTNLKPLFKPSCLCLLIGGFFLGASKEEKNNFFPVPLKSSLIEKNRFISKISYEDTKTFYKERFFKNDQYVFLPEINLPFVRYVHLKNNSGKGNFRGINIYQKSNGVVEIFFLEDSNKKP